MCWVGLSPNEKKNEEVNYPVCTSVVLINLLVVLYLYHFTIFTFRLSPHSGHIHILKNVGEKSIYYIKMFFFSPYLKDVLTSRVPIDLVFLESYHSHCILYWGLQASQSSIHRLFYRLDLFVPNHDYSHQLLHDLFGILLLIFYLITIPSLLFLSKVSWISTL